jgi:hypothetical protein
MSMSGYIDDYDCDNYSLGLYRGTVTSAARGKRGQEFFKALLAAMDAMPEKRLIAHELETPEGSVCAIGALGKARGVEMKNIDPEDADRVAGTFNIAACLAREVVYMNDEGSGARETPEERWTRMRVWVESQISAKPQPQHPGT